MNITVLVIRTDILTFSLFLFIFFSLATSFTIFKESHLLNQMRKPPAVYDRPP